MTPKRSCAPPRATRKPVITSSKTRSAPDASHNCRRTWRYPSTGGVTPQCPPTGPRRSDAHVPRGGLEDDRGEPLSVTHDRGRDGFDVVVRDDNGVLRDCI